MELNNKTLQELNDILSIHLPWSPLDFIKEISIEGDKKLYANLVTSEVEPANDLRFIHDLADEGQVAVFAEKLPWDTNFFGYGVGRLHGIFPIESPYYRPKADYSTALSELLKIAKKKNILYLFAAIDPRDLSTLRALGEMGFNLIESRSYYHMDVRHYSYPERFDIRPATPDDIESLGRTAVEMVNIYDRFHADPFIEAKESDQLMYQWVRASILENFADVTIVPRASKPSAFCTVKYHKDRWDNWNLRVSQPVFSAVSPEFKGWYRKIISEINYHLQEIGAEHSFLITQATNKAVIWIWEGLGYRFGKGELVFRKLIR